MIGKSRRFPSDFCVRVEMLGIACPLMKIGMLSEMNTHVSPAFVDDEVMIVRAAAHQVPK